MTDVKGFVSGARKLLTDREFAEKLGRKAKERARLFSIKEMTDAYEQC
jgi:hypothetical protein